jgi:DnaK suppressor protein
VPDKQKKNTKSKDKDKDKLTAAEIENFKAMLLEKRNEILGNVKHMEDETLRKSRSELSSTPIHMADVGSDNYELENMLGLMDSERRIVREIDDALHRIEEGIYGICEGNDEPIPKARLNAIPWARYCVACANQMEKGRGKRQGTTSDANYYGHLDEETFEEFNSFPETEAE